MAATISNDDENEGLCVGGPMDGKRLSSKMKRVNVPVPSAGGYGQVVYDFEFGMWIYWKRSADD